MCEQLCCVHDNLKSIYARLFILGYMVYQDDVLDVSNFGGGDINFKVAGVCYVWKITLCAQ